MTSAGTLRRRTGAQIGARRRNGCIAAIGLVASLLSARYLLHAEHGSSQSPSQSQCEELDRFTGELRAARESFQPLTPSLALLESLRSTSSSTGSFGKDLDLAIEAVRSMAVAPSPELIPDARLRLELSKGLGGAGLACLDRGSEAEFLW